MSYIYPRNVAGFTTLDSLLINNLDIQTQSVGGFKIYSNDPTVPLFSVDGLTGTITTTGTLNVLGTVSFTQIAISNTTQSMFEVAAANSSTDLLDIGLYGEYNSGGGSFYGGVYRNSTDPARRWFFVNNFTCTPPITTVPGITSANFAGIVTSDISTNNGTVSAPAYTFYTDSYTGFYAPANNSIAITAGGLNAVTFTNTGSAINMTLGTTSSLYYSLQATINDRSSSSGGITTGSITLKSIASNDKWQHYISTNPISAYSGSVYSFGSSNHYFITDSNSSLLFSFTTETLGSITDAPDYRHSSKIDLLNINSSFMSVSVPVYSTLSGNVSLPAYTFSDNPSTGMYQQTVNSVSFAAQGVQVLDLHSTYIFPSQQIQALSGTVSSPQYSFSTASTTGLFRDTSLAVENVSFALGGVLGGKFIMNSGSHPQIQMNLGTTIYPSFTFDTTGAGIYSPQIGGATQGLISIASNSSDVWIFKNRSGTLSLGSGNHQCLNVLDIIPDATTTTARFDMTSNKLPIIKSQTGSIQGYNLVDSSVLLFYRFKNFASLGIDSSESVSKINAIVIGSPSGQYAITDGTTIKKYVLDLSTNNSPTPMYLNLTSYISNFASVNLFTISFWFKCSSVPSDNGTIINLLNTSNNKNLSIRILNASDAIEVIVNSDSLTSLKFNSNGVSIKNNLWHHVVLELGTGGNLLYLDGTQLINNTNLTYTSGGNGVPTADYSTNTLNNLTFNRITIGGVFDGTSFSSAFTGYLYSIYITASKLFPSQIAALYAEGSLSVYSLDVTTLNVANQISTGQTTVEDGTVSAPAYSFSNEINTGLYRIGSGNLGLSLLGTNTIDINSTRIKNVGVYYGANGSVSSPTYSYTGDSSSGWYSLGSSSLGLAIGGVNKLLVNSIVQIGSGATDTTTQLYLPNGSAATPACTFTSNTNMGFYRIGSNNLGISLNGVLSLDLNSTRLYSINPIYVPNGLVTAPGMAFNANSSTGIYYVASNNAINIANNGVLNATFENSATPRLALAQGSLAVPSLTFTGATNYGIFYDSGTTSVKFVAGGVNTLKLTSALTNINTATTISSTCTATIYYASTNGSNTSSAISFTNDVTTGMFLQNVGVLSLAANALEGFRAVLNSASSSYITVGNITGASTYTNDNSLRFAGLLGKQSSSFNYTVLAERFWTGTTNSEMLLFKNINSTDRIRLRAYTHVFQAPTSAETYSTLADNNTVCTMVNGIVYIGGGTAGDTTLLQLPTGSNTAPSLAFIASTNTGFYYVATNQLGITTGGINTWTFAASGSAHISYNPLTVAANGSTTSVSINSKKISATATQTLLNSTPIVAYNFTNTGALATDNSINNYTGGINGSVSTYVPSADTAGNGPLNPFAIQLASGAGNGIYTNVSTMTEMANTTTINATILVQFNSVSVAGTCWVLYGNYAVPTQDYVRLYLTATGVLNIICVSGSTTTIQATYSGLSANLWYTIEFVTTGSGNGIYINKSSVVLTYTTGSSATTFLLNTSLISNTGSRLYLGGGINSLNSPSCNIGYFGLIQTGSTDTVATTYREQVHELTTNKLTVSGYPYNSTSTGLYEGYYAVSSKVGQLQWDNSIQTSSTSVIVNSNKDLSPYSLKMLGMIKYNFTTNANASISLTADRISHYISVTNNNPTITLPTGSSQNGREFVFIYRGTPGVFTITTSGSDTIGGSASPFTYSSATYTTFKIIYDATSTDWIFI